jgi:hypothetical protein
MRIDLKAPDEEVYLMYVLDAKIRMDPTGRSAILSNRYSAYERGYMST